MFRAGAKSRAGPFHGGGGTLELDGPQPQGVRDFRHRAQAHGPGGENGAQEDSDEGEQDTRPDRHSQDIVDEGEERVLPDIAERRWVLPNVGT